MRETWTFTSAGQLVFGRHAVRQIGEHAKRINAQRVFIITDPILVKAGLLEQVRTPLIEAGLTVDAYTESEAEPSSAMIEKAVDAARAFRPDTLVGLGGGSNMDAAKLAATVLVHGGKVTDTAGDDRIPGPIMPLICVPTTAGTGSEVSGAAVFGDTEKQMKIGVLSNYLRPKLAIVDPMLTLSCPPKVSADSGIDALTHAIEAFTAIDNAEFPLPVGERSVYQGKHPFGDMLAEKAIILVGKYLRRAVRDGSDLEAREGMALAATMAGLAFSNVGVALVHAMEYPVGGATHVSHGAGNGLLLPYVMRYNLSARKQAFAQIATWLGHDVSGLNKDDAAFEAITAVEELRNDIGIPKRLRELGVTEEQLSGFADRSFAVKRILRVNPKYPTLDEILGIFRDAL